MSQTKGDSADQVSRQSSTVTVLNESSGVAHWTKESKRSASKAELPLSSAIGSIDEPGFEASEYAHVWHVYNDEATKVDSATIDGFHRGIDVLLVFTGLFSAVLTTFIIQTYQQMTPQASDTTNLLLEQLILSLQTERPSSIAGSSPNVGKGVPSLTDLHWVNGLWFAALACSLSAALISMLGKQWIHQPPTGGSSSNARYRARQRQKRHQQMLSWHVFTIINALPLLLHIALLLFFAGLIVLLWSGNIAIMAVTFAIVAFAYSFYVGSIWVSLLYPDCPYQHPLTASLRQWILERPQSRVGEEDIERHLSKESGTRLKKLPKLPVDVDDAIDARALTWLLQLSCSDDVASIALQAIGGLPRTFSAFQLLREAGAIPLVLQRFACCFLRDSMNLQWHAIDPDAAEKYCRSWIRLTHNTSECWPQHLEAPLQLLQTSVDIQASSIARCVVAVNAVDSPTAQLALVSQLQTYAQDYNVNDMIQCWLLETFFECSLNWEFPSANRDDIVKKVVPPLILLLKRVSGSPRSPTRSLIALVLHSLTGGEVDPTLLINKNKQENCYHLAIIPSLAAILDEPSRFGIKGDLFDFLAIEFTRIATPITSYSNIIPVEMKKDIRKTLSSLYSRGTIKFGRIPDILLAEVLQILHPFDDNSPSRQLSYTKLLLETLAASSDPNVAIYAIRLLESLLLDGHPLVVEAFSDQNGVSTLVRAANTGDTDSRRLQIDCIRTLCLFIQSAARLGTEQAGKHCEVIFHSEADFFSTLISAIGARRWWLPEVADVWLPSLVLLCEVRPREQVWIFVESSFRNFAELHCAEDGAQRMLKSLEALRSIMPDPTSERTSMESRKYLRSTSQPPSRKSTWEKSNFI
ncbi:hypothetical protein CPB83DRAFT_794580 [Crepidotus variabilis]|uniref:DUF6535 domain-containing protein n=1 Tax=Crepidotus variabilis TaxID=179855 RepID=A0A9P6JMU8_9AGAR|nr:hypothetical protein CPB83DRAFT_794580 [Crepidotus variabilis]